MYMRVLDELFFMVISFLEISFIYFGVCISYDVIVIYDKDCENLLLLIIDLVIEILF